MSEPEYRWVQVPTRRWVRCLVCRTVFREPSGRQGQKYCSRECYRADIQHPRRYDRRQDIVEKPDNSSDNIAKETTP